MLFINTEYEKLEYYESIVGSKENIVFVHGNMSSAVFFNNLMKELKEYNSYAFSMRGFGESSYYNHTENISGFVNDLQNFIIKKDLNDIILIAWSFGGGVALNSLKNIFINRRVKKVILLSSIGLEPFRVNGLDKNYYEYLNPLNYFDFASNKTFENFFINLNEDFFSNTFFGNDLVKSNLIRYIFDNYLYNLKKPPKDEFKRNIEAAVKQRSFREVNEILSKYSFNERDIPKNNYYVFNGDRDLIISIDVARKTARALGAKFKIFKNCGHSIITDNLNGLAEEIRNVIKD